MPIFQRKNEKCYSNESSEICVKFFHTGMKVQQSAVLWCVVSVTDRTCSCAALLCCFIYYLLTVIMTRQCNCDKCSARPICERKTVDIELLQLKNSVISVCVCVSVCLSVFVYLHA